MPTEVVYCTCCGDVTIAVIRDGKVVIKKRSHGQTHVGSVVLDKKA